MNNVEFNGGGFFGMLFIVFLVLKLTDTIDWSWWWVTAPLWGGLALFLLFVAVGLAITSVFFLGEHISRRRSRKRRQQMYARARR